jgi:hypothetical protein
MSEENIEQGEASSASGHDSEIKLPFIQVDAETDKLFRSLHASLTLYQGQSHVARVAPP